MPKASVSISHSGADKAFAAAVVEALRNSDLAPWIDKERISVGTSILEEIGKGLTIMDAFVLIVSDAAMKSGWVKREAEFAVHREVTEKKTLILPFIIDRTALVDLPWHLQTRSRKSITPDQAGVDVVVDSVRRRLALREAPKDQETQARFRPLPEVEALIEGHNLGDWAAAEQSALTVLAQTDAQGRNSLFRALLTYRDVGEHESIIKALAIAQMCVGIAPWIVDRSDIIGLACHPDFTVRSSAAFICMKIANVEPARVPVDILLSLSRYDEDWYVQAPANAALKAMAHATPAVMRIFIDRLKSEEHDEREHAASQLFDISKEEPEILNQDILSVALDDLERSKDKNATDFIAKALANVKKTKRKPKYQYRYGL
jgi:hypothetical protein